MQMSDLQRRKYFALISDIAEYTGYTVDYVHMLFKFMYAIRNDFEVSELSFKQIDMTTARKIIDMVLEWCFENGVPLAGDTGYLFKNDIMFFYYLAYDKQCFICGSQKTDKRQRHTHHIDKIGMGSNRNIVVHVGRRIMILCGEHHSQYHNEGHNKFINKHHIPMLKLDEKLKDILKL